MTVRGVRRPYTDGLVLDCSNSSALAMEILQSCSKPSIWRITWSLSWWRHQMETFSALLAICAGNPPVTGEFSAQRPVTLSFDVFCDLRLNKRLSKQWWGWWFETPSRPLWRHCNVFAVQCFFRLSRLELAWKSVIFLEVTGTSWILFRSCFWEPWIWTHCSGLRGIKFTSKLRLIDQKFRIDLWYYIDLMKHG